MAFFGGSTGIIYQQFSITIVSAMTLSVLVALIFTPALCATILKQPSTDHDELNPFFRWFNRNFNRSASGYERAVGFMLSRKWRFLVIYGVVGADARGALRPHSGRLPALGGSGDHDGTGSIATQLQCGAN